jgi:ketosteroid isomerase-like protein
MTADDDDLPGLVRELARRVEQLEAERDIRVAIHRYCTAIDDGDSDAWADVFTPNGVWEVGGPGARTQLRLEGTDALRRFASEHSHAPMAWHKHCTVASSIALDGDSATATSYTFRLDGLDDGPGIQSFGRYVDRLTRGPDGRWRIVHRSLQVESSRDSPFGHQPEHHETREGNDAEE